MKNLYYLAFVDQLGADPVESVIHFTGIGALNLLLITLCVSPLAKWLKKGYLLQTRRLLGLYAFTYALLHVLNFLAFEIQFDAVFFFSEVIERPYITVGMLAFLLLSASCLDDQLKDFCQGLGILENHRQFHPENVSKIQNYYL